MAKKARIIAGFGAIAIMVIAIVLVATFSQKDEFTDYETVSSDVDAISGKWVADSGFVAAEDVESLLDEVVDYAKASSDVVSYERSEDCVAIELSSGMIYLYQAPLEGMASSGKDVSIVTFEPWWTDVEGSDSLRLEGGVIGDWPDVSGIDEWSYYVAETMDGYSMSQADALNDSSVSVEAFKNIQSNQLFVYYGHGCYTNKLGSCLTTGEEVTRESRKALKEDIKAHRVVASGDRYIVTADFFDYYYDTADLAGTNVFLLACHSLQDERLAQVLVGKGASVVTGFNESVKVKYLCEIFYSMMGVDEETGLTDVSPSGYYYTFQEALEIAKARYGESDPYVDDGFLWFKDTPAECVCYPESAAAETRLSDTLVVDIDAEERNDSDTFDELDLTGVWEIDKDRTMGANGCSMTDIFGSSIKYGSEMEIRDDGYFSYYIAAGIGGRGMWERGGDQISYQVETYEEGAEEDSTLEITEDGYLIYSYFGYEVYWAKKDWFGYYVYSDGEYLSTLVIYDLDEEMNAVLGFWPDYGDKASQEDFYFTWAEGTYVYELVGQRSNKEFTVTFTPTNNGMHIKVECKEEYYSWPSSEKSSVWIDADYRKQ